MIPVLLLLLTVLVYTVILNVLHAYRVRRAREEGERAGAETAVERIAAAVFAERVEWEGEVEEGALRGTVWCGVLLDPVPEENAMGEPTGRYRRFVLAAHPDQQAAEEYAAKIRTNLRRAALPRLPERMEASDA